MYFFSDKIAFASSSAQPVTEIRESGRLSPRSAHRGKAPDPAHGPADAAPVAPSPTPAPTPSPPDATPQHASVAFTAGILNLMTDREIEGVVAHELGHLLHHHILISSVAATIAAAIMFISPHGLLVRRF